MADQTQRIEALRRSIAQEEASLNDVRKVLGLEALSQRRGGTATNAPNVTPAAASTGINPNAPDQQVAQTSPPQPVGQAPSQDNRQIAAIAPIFEQPGLLTPKGHFGLEPSVQYSYSSSNRVALVGYTIIPAILIGLIDVREVKRNTFTGTLTTRYGLTNRFEIEARVPYVYRSDVGVGRAFLHGAASDTTVFDSSGHGIGDVEATGRYQINDGGADRPYYIASLRFKSRTGKDPFQVETSRAVLGFQNDGVQTSLPTGSGFYGLQPALTVLYPSDPAVFFGTVSYLHSFRRGHVVRATDTGPEDLGSVSPGGIFGFNFGMGLALNDRSSFSIGYDHASVGKTKLNGVVAPDSVRVELGTLLLGYSLRLNAQRTISLSLGAGLTRDTPDLTLTLRVPMSL
ncbi:MAG: acetate kinase [Burkholderiaceae bacterium]